MISAPEFVPSGMVTRGVASEVDVLGPAGPATLPLLMTDAARALARPLDNCDAR